MFKYEKENDRKLEFVIMPAYRVFDVRIGGSDSVFRVSDVRISGSDFVKILKKNYTTNANQPRSFTEMGKRYQCDGDFDMWTYETVIVGRNRKGGKRIWKGSIPQINSSVITTDEHQTHNIRHETLQEGVASGYFSTEYNALREVDKRVKVGNYIFRVTGYNKEGYGVKSDLVYATTAAKGNFPAPPESVTVGLNYGTNSLSLYFEPPPYDGGMKITKYRIEWDT